MPTAIFTHCKPTATPRHIDCAGHIDLTDGALVCTCDCHGQMDRVKLVTDEITRMRVDLRQATKIFIRLSDALGRKRGEMQVLRNSIERLCELRFTIVTSNTGKEETHGNQSGTTGDRVSATATGAE